MAERQDTPTATRPSSPRPDGSLWLFWPTILDHRWEGALLKYARCDHPLTGRGALEVVDLGRPARHAHGLRHRDEQRNRDP